MTHTHTHTFGVHKSLDRKISGLKINFNFDPMKPMKMKPSPGRVKKRKELIEFGWVGG